MDDLPEAIHPIILTHIDALNTGNLQNVLETFTPHAEFTSPAGTAVGTAELADLLGPTLIEPRAVMHLISARSIASADGERILCHVRRSMILADEGRVIAQHEIDLMLTITIEDQLIARCHTALL